MPTAEIEADLVSLEQNALLRAELNFAARATALDFLEFHVLDRLGSLRQVAPAGLLLRQRAERLQQQLEAIDAALFQRLRAGVRAGQYRGEDFRALAEAYVGRVAIPAGASQVGYDLLDDFTNGLFPLPVLPQETAAREPEMVHYQKTPARIVFELTATAAFTKEDVFVDIGAGLGHVPLLVGLLSGVAARGVEIEPAYCEIAAGWAADLGLPQVAFRQADARYFDYAEGTVFFLYTPFGGGMLAEVLERLRAESQRRRIRLFTYGPCTRQVARQPWLRGVGPAQADADRLALFES